MSNATLDRVLAILIVALVATGLISLRAGSPPTAPLFLVHGLLGGALLAATVMKLHRSTPRAVRQRRWGRLALAAGVTLLTAAALAGGLAWVVSGRILQLGSWTVLTLHIWAGLALLPILVLHLLPRRWRVLRPSQRTSTAPRETRMSRRAFIATGGLGVASLATWGVAQAVERLTGATRRFTGSRWLPSGGIPPVTTFFGEGTPAIDRAAWRLRVHGRVTRPLELTLSDLAALGESDLAAVLDCTSGWVIETDWRGVPLSRVLGAAGVADDGRDVTVRSVTGWYARLPLEEANRTLLATSVAGEPLPAGNGAPCRLVVPDRRGLEWVKWIAEVEVG